VAPAIPVAIAPTTPAAAAAILPSTPTASATPALFGPVAALAVDGAVPTGFKRHRCGLAATGTNHGRPRAHAGSGASTSTVTAAFVGMRRSVTSAPASTLLSLAARFTAPGRGVAAFLKKLLFTSSENKFLTAVATG
jgi:hypothetical protein